MTKVEYDLEKNKLTVRLIGDIDHHGARAIRQGIDNEILRTSPAIVIMDFGKVTFMDSSGIGLVLARHRFCRQLGVSVYVGGVNKSYGRILALAGIKTIGNMNT